MQDKQARSESYRLLAACFYPPDGSWLDEQETFFEDLNGVLNPVCPEAAELSLHLKQAVGQSELAELSIEYARLFVGPFELLAPPYGSIYLERQRQVMGDSTMAVLKMYQEYGLKIADDFKELPDHVAVELEFMYYLSYKEIEALQQADQENALSCFSAQKQFMNLALKGFIPPFCKKINIETAHRFYSSLADCVLTFVQHDYDLLLSENTSPGEEHG